MSAQIAVNEPSGVLIVNKHAGVTSHDIVGKIRRLYGTRRVGHAGTLDPMATGVLVVLIGRAAKASEYLVSDSKRYRAGLRLGVTTDTEDTTGTVLSKHEGALPSFAELEEALSAFRSAANAGNNGMERALEFNQIVAYEYTGNFKQAAVLMEAYLKKYPDDEAALREYEFLKSR